MNNGILLLLGAVFVSTVVCQPSEAGPKHEPNTDLNGCVTAVHSWGITLKHDIASFMGVSQESMPALFCQRLAAGLRSGRISYSDINNLQLDQPTEIWMVIKGKSKPPEVTQAPAPRSSKFRNCTGIDGAFQVPVSQKCPLSGYAHFDQPTEMDAKGRPKATTQVSAPRASNFRTCSGMDGIFQIPVSQKCPLSGYARH